MKKRRWASYGVVTAATLAAAVVLSACEFGDLCAPETRVNWSLAIQAATWGVAPADQADPWAAIERARLERKAGQHR